MKKILLIFALLPLFCLAQNKLEFTEVVKVENTSAKELHDRCLDWFALTFNNSDAVLKQSSEDKLIAKPVIIYTPNVFSGSDQTRGTIDYIFMIEFKDDKFKYTINSFYHTGNPYAVREKTSFGTITADTECPVKINMTTKNWRNKVWEDIKVQINQSIIPLITNLKTSMQKTVDTVDDDW